MLFCIERAFSFSSPQQEERTGLAATWGCSQRVKGGGYAGTTRKSKGSMTGRGEPMILESLQVDPAEFERGTGWAIRQEGACKDDRCVPLPDAAPTATPGAAGGRLDVRILADRLGMPLIHDEASGLWCLGPEAGGRALSSARAPELILPDVNGREFRLSSLRGNKVLLVAWASW